MNRKEEQHSTADKTCRESPVYDSASPQLAHARAERAIGNERVNRFIATREPSEGFIKYCKRSYEVGDLLRGLDTAWNPGELVLIVRSSGHSSYFYGIACSTGQEHLFNLQHYVGVGEL